jgi:transcription antitermination factor NusG
MTNVHSSVACRSAASLPPAADVAREVMERRWYAVFTLPQNERSTARNLDLREVESFVPTYETERVWKNRQRVKLTLPLFPSYLFVRVLAQERGRVLQCPGVVRIVGSQRQPIPVPDHAIEFLRSDATSSKIEPYHELIEGQRVRITSGAMKGLEGVLLRRSNQLRFIITIDLIGRHVAVEVGREQLETVTA